MTRSALALVLALTSCRSGGSTAPPAPAPPTPAAPAPAAPPPAASASWIGGTEIESNDGNWRVVYKLANGPVKRGEIFAIDAWVFAADAPEKAREDVSLAVDAAMPQHGHGMNRVPRVEKMGAGRFHVDGLDFHMPGKWELYFDVARGARVERAQTDVEVE